MRSGTLVLGLIDGTLIGLLAVGIVLVYMSNRFLNLVYAQLGALPAQLLAKLVIDEGWNSRVAFSVWVPVGILVGLGARAPRPRSSGSTPTTSARQGRCSSRTVTGPTPRGSSTC